MNMHGNLRSQATKNKINKALMYLLKRKHFNDIYVKDICTIACINRSSFYEHYQDINDLMIKTEANLSQQIAQLFAATPFAFQESDFIKMFTFIQANHEFYTAYLNNHEGSFMAQTDFQNFHHKFRRNTDVRLQYTEKELLYHMAFFGGALTAICKVWLNSGMTETPAEMAQIIYHEYQGKSQFFA